MRMLPLAAALAVVAVVVPLGTVVRDGDEPAAGRPDAPLWSGTATLLQTPDGRLTLCGGVTLTSLPPAGCGGALVRGLDPMSVEGAERFADGTITTPSVRVVGIWDGEALTPTRPVELADPPPGPAVDVPGPTCPEPAGGWPFDRADMAGMGRVTQYAASQPDAGTPRVDDSQRILTVPFTGDLERHRAAIARLYDGPICLEAAEHSARELNEVFARVRQDLEARGLVMLSGTGDGSVEPYVDVTVVAVTEAERAELEAAYDGVLRLRSFLIEV